MARVTVVKKARVSKYERKCDFPGCGHVIAPGDGFKHISPRVPGSLGSVTRYRCLTHPDWHLWEYSSSLSARIAEIQYDGNNEILQSDENTIEDLPTILGEKIRELADEKRESAQNIEDGFGHSTSLSDELNGQAYELESWADSVESVDILGGKPEEEDEDEKAVEYLLEDARNRLTDALEDCPL